MFFKEGGAIPFFGSAENSNIFERLAAEKESHPPVVAFAKLLQEPATHSLCRCRDSLITSTSTLHKRTTKMSVLFSISRPVITKTSQHLSARSCSRLNNIAIRSMAGTAESRTSAVRDGPFSTEKLPFVTRYAPRYMGSFLGVFQVR